ncbi:MAG TPA: DNA alkylation repair protein [Dehalococcoidia bacterium]|nr:DNA alkylation repair protein [Dehalococcoidia bacterium]
MPSGAEAVAQADELERELRRLGRPERAASERRYLKSDLEFIGVDAAGMRSVLRAYLQARDRLDHDALVELVGALWDRPIHERRALAVSLLERQRRLLGAEDLPLLERLLRDALTWAYVDALAVHVVGWLVERHPELSATLDRWAADPDFWIRRSALLALLPPLRRGTGDFERFARYADAMLEEREFFIRKAIGWVLREASKSQPELVYAWVAPRTHRTSGVTIREAVKYLPKAQRAALLAAYTEKRPTA